MDNNAKELIKSSLEKEHSFSSSSHILETFVAEGEPPVAEYEIPSRYNKDTLRMLFVNTEKYYVYWEVSDETLEKSGLDLTIDKLVFKIYDIDGTELYSFESSFALGDHYIKRKFENMDIFVKIGRTVDNDFVELQTSNTIHTFSSQINLPDEKSDAWIKKSYGWSEVIRSTIHHYSGASSASYVEEMERLKHFTDEEEQRLSSLTIHEGNR
jgi:hypothetical protein